MGDAADMLLDSMFEGDDYVFQSWVPRHSRMRRARPAGPGPCPECGAETTMRSGPYGTFYGCSNYPRCKGSRKDNGVVCEGF